MKVVLPDFRTQEYAEWKCCERFGVRPPGVAAAWEECDTETRALMLAYSQIREEEDNERASGILSAGLFG